MSESYAPDARFVPGTRWRYKAVTEIGGKLIRTGGSEPMYIVFATDHHVIYETHWGPGLANITEKICRRKDFERKYEVSCCHRHDREPGWTGDCHTVAVPEEGTFLVVNGEVREGRIVAESWGKVYDTADIRILVKRDDSS